MTTYTLVQAGATVPTVDQLKRAFAFTDCLRDADAAKLALEARGLLLKNLSYDNAYRVQCALKEDGVATEILEPGDLPALPEGRLTRRLGFSDEALLVFDVLGRAAPLEWSRLALVAAGGVGHFEVTLTRTEERVLRFSPLRGLHPETVSESHHVLETERQLILELLAAGGGPRVQVEAKGFLFGYCIQPPELDLEEKFARLVRAILERAPQALRNRGADALAAGAPVAEYASRGTLHDEMVWMLWRRDRERAPLT